MRVTIDKAPIKEDEEAKETRAEPGVENEIILSVPKSQKMQTDKGKEFLNRQLQDFLKEKGIHHFTTHNEETKSCIGERFSRTLKTRMWRYFSKYQTLRYLDVVQNLVDSYNASYHRSIGMSPVGVNVVNQEDVAAIVWKRKSQHNRTWFKSLRSRSHQ